MAKETSDSVYVQAQGKTYGPYKEEELNGHIESGRVPFSAWLYKEGSWELLAENAQLRKLHPEFEPQPKGAPSAKDAQTKLTAAAPAKAASSQPAGATVSAEPIWFYIRDRKKFGPYSSADLIAQLQRKQLEPTTFVWRPGFQTWQKMSQVSEFSRDSMRRLADEGVPFDILVKRKHTRAPFDVEVIAHDNTRAIEGRSMVIGEGGLFLATPKPSHNVGARLKLHFREGQTPSFNAVAEVVSVVKGENSGYCLRFVALSDSDRRRIAKFVSERK